MTIEALEKRIEGKKKSIDKLTKKLERILKAKESDYKENNPYYYSDRDLKYTERDLENDKKALADYEDQLAKEIEKAGSRNVKVLVEFLERWKERTIAWFIEERERFETAFKEYNIKEHEYYDTAHHYKWGTEERSTIEKERKEYRNAFWSTWSHVTQFDHATLSWEENMRKQIEIEKNRKYDDIIERTNKITGKITDASNLRIDAKQNINGYIIGERGKAKVETIGAGGYNIQCYHFRTLIHEYKE